MKLKLLLAIIFLSLCNCGFTQDGNKAFAITGSGTGDFNWMNIRQIDLSTGLVTKNIYEKGVTNFQMRNAASGKEVLIASQEGGKQMATREYPTATMVAAAAYDKKHEKLFFAPMFLNELRWLDLSNTQNPTFYTFQSPILNFGNTSNDAIHITRMTIGADGNGYALTNDGYHLIKFTTGKKLSIKDLGAIIDASTNNQISLHNQCSSWGGDMVADALGNLYLFTASKIVFKIDVAKKVATYLGSITGVSNAYTVNGAAVIDDHNVIISSANTFEGFYKVNINDLSAVKLTTSGQIFNASDLANGNLLFESQVRNNLGSATLIPKKVLSNQFISIYPNPVFGSQFKITFNNKEKGEYNITITDAQGKIITSKQLFIKSSGQVETIQLKSKPVNGVYLIKLTSDNKKFVFSDKIIFE